MPRNLFDKIWYIKFQGSGEEGPYSIQQLRHHPRVTPDTLVCKEGNTVWMPIRNVLELAAVFEDSTPLNEKKSKSFTEPAGEEIALDMGYEMPPYYFWALLLTILGLFILFQTYW